ncbi:MAG: hypothetical protein R6T99_01650 [Bacteroidales bacterium]
MYTSQILWLLSLPVLIFITYRIILVALKHQEKKVTRDRKK